MTKHIAEESENEVTEMWRAHRQDQQAKRAKNRASSPEMLKQAGITFEVKNGGAHLVVGDWDFWPGTGLWRARRPKNGRHAKGYGVRNLIKMVKP